MNLDTETQICSDSCKTRQWSRYAASVWKHVWTEKQSASTGTWTGWPQPPSACYFGQTIWHAFSPTDKLIFFPNMGTCRHVITEYQREFPAFIKPRLQALPQCCQQCPVGGRVQHLEPLSTPPNYYIWKINMQTIWCWSSLRVPSSRTQTPMPSFVRHAPNSPAAITGRHWVRTCRSFQKTAGKCYCCVSATHRGCDISIMFGAFCCVQVLPSFVTPGSNVLYYIKKNILLFF